MSSPAWAEDKAAAQHDEQARAYFRTGAFVQAAEEFAKAFEAEAKPTRLFNAGLAYEKAGEKRSASEFFGKYLQVAPSGEKAIEARARKAALDQSLAESDRQAKLREQEQASNATARQHESRATEQLGTKEYAAAAQSFEEAFAANGNVEFLFEKAEALRIGNMRSQALSGYRRYLREAPQGLNRPQAERRQRELEAPASATSKPAVPTEANAAEPEVSAGSSSGTSTMRTVGYVTAGVGILSLSVSGFFALRASGLESDLEGLAPGDGDTWGPEQEEKLQDGEDAASNARILAATGGLLLVGGVVLYYLGADSAPESSGLSLTPSVGPETAGLTFSGRF